MPFAIEGFVRGPAGTALETLDDLFEAARYAGVSPAFDEDASQIVLRAFAELRWPGKLFLNLRPSSLETSPRVVTTLRCTIDSVGLHSSQMVLELTEHEPIPDASFIFCVGSSKKLRKSYSISIDPNPWEGGLPPRRESLELKSHANWGLIRGSEGPCSLRTTPKPVKMTWFGAVD